MFINVIAMYSLTLVPVLCILACVGVQHVVDCTEKTITCTKQLRYCKLKDINPDLFTKGAKGERGDDGVPGLKGANGSSGLKGAQGAAGFQGIKGERGDMGRKGEKGDATRSSIVGPPGLAGVNGVYDGKFDDVFPCINSNSEGDKKTIRVGPSEEEFEAYCGPNPMEICIPKQGVTGAFYNYMDKVNPFWISEVGMDLQQMYGITNAHLESLKVNTTYVRQTLRYHCKNSKPYSTQDITKAVRLLSWNDKLVGPYPSDITPLFYSVINDGCSKGGIDSEHTDIVLVSSVVDRLPIIDVKINDIRRESQLFYIELVELCFAVHSLYFTDTV